tara:strand:+ start:326 stop:2929 length:2604 start_codon:yes stop_codon:yes gene_type:complete
MDLVSQNLLLTSGGGKKSTFVEDVFSPYLYEGNETSRSINNGVDNTEGGMVWIKNRDNGAFPPYVYDTVRGVNKQLRTSSNANETSSSNTLTAFNNNGFSMGTDTMINRNGDSHVAWNFRKAPGFFDVVTFTSTGDVNQRIPHGLECEPGMIICKSLTNTSYWVTYHKELPNEYPSDPWSKSLILDEAYGAGTYASDTWGTGPTSTDFGFKAGGFAAVGTEWVAYVFAGGSSSAATARSVEFDSAGFLTIADSSDWALGQTWTIEAWIKPDSISGGGVRSTIVAQDSHWWFSVLSSGTLRFANDSSGAQSDSNSGAVKAGVWTHVAFVVNSGTGQWYVNGAASGSTASWNISDTSGALFIGKQSAYHWPFDGKISNLRIVKGTAVYTSSFKPTYEPLTNITNTKLLCCNNSSVTGSTVSPGTIINTNIGSGTLVASTDSPFDDPEGFQFGEEGDQNIIKAGSYKTDSNEDANVYLGWEPQWVLIKRWDSSTGGDWLIYDSMRGFLGTAGEGGGGSLSLSPDNNSSENDNNRLKITSTGFYADDYGANRSYIYMALRRPDGYVGKPAKVGTDAFAMDYGVDASVSIPCFDSGFPVDIAMYRNPTSTSDNYVGVRLIGPREIYTNDNPGDSSFVHMTYDYMDGFRKTGSTSLLAWMWKRGAGCDVITYNGNGAIRDIPHSLGRTPEMMWIKRRDTGGNNWQVYHKGLNGGTNPEQYYMYLNTTAPETSQYAIDSWNHTAPTATHFTLGTDGNVNNGSSGRTYMAMLFASVNGISKVGYYTGNGSTQTITTGFSPRFAIIRRTDGSEDHWLVLDTTRGWVSGNDKGLKLNSNSAQGTSEDYGAPTSTGFSLTSNGWVNYNTGTYIYYAHA